MSVAATVAVLGEALVDEFHDGPVPGGAPFNVARALAGVGVPVCFVSRVGQDGHAERLAASAGAYGLSMAAVQSDPHRTTGRVSVEEGEGGHRFVIHADAAWDHIELAPAEQSLAAQPLAFFYFGSLAQRHPQSRDTLRRLLKRSSAHRFLDLNLRPGTDTAELAAESLMLADAAKVNDDELDQLTAWFAPDAEQPVAALMGRFALQRLIVTRGREGWSLFGAGGAMTCAGDGVEQPALVDTVGAGDAFTALWLAGQALGCREADVLPLANRFAAFICGVRGPLPADPTALQPWREQLHRLKAERP